MLIEREHLSRYLHSKGVVRHETNPKERTGVRLWRYIMEYHLVARWRRCMELLETHDAVGASFRHQPRGCMLLAASSAVRASSCM